MFKFKPKQYGLIDPKKKNETTKSKLVWGTDDDDDDEQQRIFEELKNKKQESFMAATGDQIDIPEDLYDIDGFLEEKESKNADMIAKNNHERPKSRYIKDMIERAKQREQELDDYDTRKNLKEIQEGEALYGKKEQFVTKAYKKKLEEKAAMRKERELKDKKDLEESAKNKRTMLGFYQELYKMRTKDDDLLLNPEKKKEETKSEVDANSSQPAVEKPSIPFDLSAIISTDIHESNDDSNGEDDDAGLLVNPNKAKQSKSVPTVDTLKKSILQRDRHPSLSPSHHTHAHKHSSSHHHHHHSSHH